MMPNSSSKEALTHYIAQCAKDCLQGRQVYARLMRLLPSRYAEIVKRLRRCRGASKARRLALMDAEYLSHLDELNQLGFDTLKARIEWDTHLMLYRCQSYIHPK